MENLEEFRKLGLSDKTLEALQAKGFEEPTEIQKLCIPLLLEENTEVIGQAQTGTGKTAAYLLPVLNQLSKGGYPADAINCIIMAPTRELAQQIDQQMEGFSYFMPASSVAVYGGNDGVRFEQEKKGLTLGADVVIATPGRLISHLSLGYVDLSKVSFFILDEADRMLDMGFADDIMQIVKYLPKERQTIMFSATMPNKIQQLAKTILTDPVEVKLAVSKPADKIIQAAYICYEAQKLGIIKSLFNAQKPGRNALRLGAVSARGNHARVPKRQNQHAGSYGHRGARHRHRRHPFGYQLRCASRQRRLRSSYRTYGARQQRRMCHHLCQRNRANPL